MRGPGLRRALPLAVALAATVSALPAAAQTAGARSRQNAPSPLESRMLRDASLLEVRGDHAGAERVLRELLQEVPTSAGALFALERALRQQERTGDVLPLIDSLLAREPTASNVRGMKLRVLVDLDSLETVEEEARRWIEAEPDSRDPYRELSGFYERAFGTAKAAELLREGRARLGEPTAFALELGDVFLRGEDIEAAVEEWSVAAGDGRQAGAVVRRVAQLGRFEEVGRMLLDALERGPTTPGRRVAAVQVALQLSLSEDALRLAAEVAPRLPDAERQALLQEVARRGDEIQAHALSLWAYEMLLELSGEGGDLRALHQRIVESSLAVGDTVRALGASLSLAESLPVGSAERRRALAQALGLSVGRNDPAAVERDLDRFRDEYPDAPELDGLAARVASGLQARGDADGATRVLQDVQGPRSALERAYLRLEAGELEAGVAALHEAIRLLPPTAATEVIQLVSLLGRVGSGATQALGRSAVLAHRGSGVQGVESLVGALAALPESDRAPLLAHAARMADHADAGARAAELRRRLVDEHRGSQEMPEAALALARWDAANGRREEAVRLLEALIVERPESPVVPDARRELDRIRGDAQAGRDAR